MKNFSRNIGDGNQKSLGNINEKPREASQGARPDGYPSVMSSYLNINNQYGSNKNTQSNKQLRKFDKQKSSAIGVVGRHRSGIPNSGNPAKYGISKEKVHGTSGTSLGVLKKDHSYK